MVQRKRPRNFLTELSQRSPWEHNENPIWMGSTLRLIRNIENFSFPAKLSSNQLEQVYSITSKEILGCSLLDMPRLLDGKKLSPAEKDFLHEHFLSPRPFRSVHGSEGFVVEASGRFFATINIKDHLQLQWIDTSHDLEGAWNKLVAIEAEVGKRLQYAFSDQFGFLTADAACSGAGLSAALYLQLPAMIHLGELEQFITNYYDDSIQVTGLQGEDSYVGDTVVLKNRYSLGVNEEKILTSLRKFGTQLMVREKGITGLDDGAKDRVARAYGLLKHSYQAGAAEVLDAISLLKLGCRMGWVSGVKMSTLNGLFFDCRRGHLLTHLGEKISQEELPHARAEFIHHAVSEAVLTI